MTYEEYALKNIQDMKSKEPTPQNMRDIALLELWLSSNTQKAVPNVSTVKIQNEINDILPAYVEYIEVKRKRMLKEVTDEKVLFTLQTLVNELQDLIEMIYRNTETCEEREILTRFLHKN